ncbi:MAG: hypothetical protein P4L51_26505 [Puia sp.]|nr:hypothetical protein [Puia sp.]
MNQHGPAPYSTDQVMMTLSAMAHTPFDPITGLHESPDQRDLSQPVNNFLKEQKQDNDFCENQEAAHSQDRLTENLMSGTRKLRFEV